MNTDPTIPAPSGPAQPVEDDDAKIEKWFWKMDYCKKHGIPPSDEQCWQIAEQKWEQRNDPPPPHPAPARAGRERCGLRVDDV